MHNSRSQLRIQEFWEEVEEVRKKEKEKNPPIGVIIYNLNNHLGNIYEKLTLDGTMHMDEKEDVFIQENFYHPGAAQSCNLILKARVLITSHLNMNSSNRCEWMNDVDDDWLRVFHDNLGLNNE
jgi:hypothetical protein